MSTRRINKELKPLEQNPIASYDVAPTDDDIYHWTSGIEGPKDTMYADKWFELNPFKPPIIRWFFRSAHFQNF